MALVLTGFAALVYWFTVDSMYHRASRTADAAFRLMETDPRMATAWEQRTSYWVREFDEHMGMFAAVYRSDGSLLRAHPALVDRSNESRAATAGRVETDAEGYQWWVAARSLGAEVQGLRVVLKIPLRDQEADLRAFRKAILLAIPVGLLASAALAYLLARASLAPVDALRRAADLVTASQLSHRLPEGNAGDELGKLAATINEMLARLERSFAEVKRFTADASHELRTPLTAIRTEAEVALAGEPAAEEYRALVESILEECGRTTRLTDQLLSLAREDAGVGHHEEGEVDLGQVVTGVVETLRPLAEAKDVAIVSTTSGECTLQGDTIRLRQVAMNLIDNAIKYTLRGGRIDIAVTRNDGKLVLTVADTGVGIPPEHLPRVFDRFYRVDQARSREMGGTGLGLSIVRSVVIAYGGAITMTSRAGEGTECVVTLPVRLRSGG
jgi:heavy metal sensor kinase